MGAGPALRNLTRAVAAVANNESRWLRRCAGCNMADDDELRPMMTSRQVRRLVAALEEAEAFLMEDRL